MSMDGGTDRLMHRTVLWTAAVVLASVLFPWVRFTQSRPSESYPGRIIVSVYSVSGINLTEGVVVFLLGALAIAGAVVCKHLSMNWAAAVAPVSGLGITGIAVYGMILTDRFTGAIDPDQVRVGFGLLVILFAGPLILGVSLMMALEVLKSTRATVSRV
ncbi:MAG: hypothetical protein KTV68_06915 [Acidimicrobiia bacterium]|nr:hypothetical protein [Acidimicrobiia bacterium]MCY4433296.1 hypothetical protein [bacterium]